MFDPAHVPQQATWKGGIEFQPKEDRLVPEAHGGDGGHVLEEGFKLVGFFHDGELARFDFGDVEDVVNDGQEALARVEDTGEAVALRGRHLIA